MNELVEQILAAISRKSYTPLKPKALARKIGVPGHEYAGFRKVLRDLVRTGRVELGKNHTVKAAQPHGTVTGVFRAHPAGNGGFVRPHVIDGKAGPEIRIPQDDSLDASHGDEVLVKLTRKPTRAGLGPKGFILQVIKRAKRQFVGTYFERDGQGMARVDGTVFAHSVYVGDPGAKGARVGDKMVLEMIRFPSAEERGEGVVTEVLGPLGKPGVDTLSIIRAYDLPDEFPELVKEGREAAAMFDEKELAGREDLRGEVIVTIDPVDARDFDDAVSLHLDPATGHWSLGVHIADVGHFAPAGSAVDAEARKRATSVYLPQRVIPMFPEVISNSLASLQEGRVRYVKSAFIDYTAAGQKTGARFANAAIKVRKRFTYEQVSAMLKALEEKAELPLPVEPEVLGLLGRMRDLALILRKRRHKRGSLELTMPEVELEYDDQGRVSGAHYASHDLSHQIIEEFMLAANEAVAEHLFGLDVPFLRRVHPMPEPHKLEAFAEFVRSLGYKMELPDDRFSIQRILEKSATRPDAHAVHYALLRSLKQAVYSPVEEGHYALASDHYCHFTSPIRRYPDLVIHRQLEQFLQRGRVGGDAAEMVTLGEHCSKMERRSEAAERELIKVKLLTYLSSRIGLEMEAVISGVADYGFFAQAEKLPVEGLVHVSTLAEDYYYYEDATHSLIGRGGGQRYRLGDKVKVQVVRVDLQRRQLDLRVVAAKRPAKGKPSKG